jgi:hypothetical protein
MTARTRSALTPALVLLAAAALAYAISLIPTLGVAHGSTPAHAAAVVAAEPAAPAPRPSDQLHDPLTDLGGAIDDARREGQAHGWALGAIVGLVLLSRALRKAHKRWPTLTTLRWMAGPAGLVVFGAGIIGSAAFDAFIFGGSWLAAGYAAIGAALYLLDPDLKLPTQSNPPTSSDGSRSPESGHIALPLLGCVAVVFLAGLAWGCASLRPTAKATAGELVDCALVAVGDHADELEAAIRDATDMRGDIDWTAPRALVRQLGGSVGGCALRLAIERLLASPGVAAIGGTGSLRAGWEQVRVEDLGGRRYLPEAMPARAP